MKDTQQRTGVLELDDQARSLIASAAMLRAQVSAKQVEMRAMREFATSENPDLARAEQELSRHGRPVSRDGPGQRPRHGRSDCAQGKNHPGRALTIRVLCAR